MDLPSTRPGGWDDPAAPSIPAPLRLHTSTVPEAWVDYNGHMSEWCYLLVMGDNSDAFFRYIGIDDDYRARGSSLFTVETHIRHLLEAGLGDELSVTLQVLGFDAKRVHIAHEVRRRDGDTIATGEQMLLHVDTTIGRAVAMPEALRARIGLVADSHRALGTPDWVGRVMTIPTPSASATTAPATAPGGSWTSS